MTPGSKQNSAWSAALEALEQAQRAVDAKARLGLAVGAVELDVAEGPLGLRPSLLDAGGALGPLAAKGKRVDEPLGGAQGLRGPPQLALDLAAAREGPLRDDDRLAAVVVEGSLGEPVLDEVDELCRSGGGSGRPRRPGRPSGPTGRGLWPPPR